MKMHAREIMGGLTGSWERCQMYHESTPKYRRRVRGKVIKCEHLSDIVKSLELLR